MQTSFEILDWDERTVSTFMMHAQRVVEVFPGSPAEHLGIRPGWLLLLAGDIAATSSYISHFRMKGADGYIFFDREANRAVKLLQKKWPFGMLLSGLGTQGYLARLEAGDYYSDELYETWGRGEEDLFTGLIPSLRRNLQPYWHGFVEPLLSQSIKDKGLAKSDNYFELHFLALAYLAQDDFQRAEFFAEACEDAMERSSDTGFSLRTTALLRYIYARIAYAKGDREKAIGLLEYATSEQPRYYVLRDTLAIWCDEPPLVWAPRFVGSKLDLDYRLPCTDTLDSFPDDGSVGLRSTLEAMTEDQVLPVFLMPNYRSNYYYNEDLITLSALYQHDPGRIPAVHVVYSGEYRLNEAHRLEAEAYALDAGLPIRMLYDENASVTDPLKLYRSPTALFLDCTGKVLANGVISDESAYWTALDNLAQNPPIDLM